MTFVSSLRNKIVIIIFGIITFYVIFVFYSDAHQFSYQWSRINLLFLPIILGIHVIAILVRAFRQKLFLDSIGLRIPLKSNISIQFAGLSMIITPGGAGEVLKTYFLNNKYGYSYAKTVTLFFAEKYHDLLAVVSILAIMLIFSKLLEAQIVVGIMSFLLLIIFLVVRNKKIFLSVISKIPKKGFLKNLSPSSEFQESIEKLTGRRIMLYGTIVGITSWLLDAVSIYLGFLAFGLDYTFINSTLVMYTATLLGAISFLPGGIGVTETGMLTLLVKSGLTVATGSAIILFTRLTSVWFYTGIGFIATKFVLVNKNLK